MPLTDAEELKLSDSRARSIKTRIETFQTGQLLLVFRQIREQDPLKQGLKPSTYTIPLSFVLYSRARSIKTRIETTFHSDTNNYTAYSRARSIKTRIETRMSWLPCSLGSLFESKIH